MTLFRRGDFTLHSGQQSDFKIDCDALTDDDWRCLADMIAARVGHFRYVEGVPTGGLKLAKALRSLHWSDGPVLLVDDVLTTGASMEEWRRRFTDPEDVRGAVIFARGPVPAWITPLFVLTGANT